MSDQATLAITASSPVIRIAAVQHLQLHLNIRSKRERPAMPSISTVTATGHGVVAEACRDAFL